MEIRHVVNEGFFIFGENGYKIVPICSYIVKKFESGEYDDLKA